MPLPAGTILHGRYRIVTILGQGGMGAVYRANDENVGVPVAVKENLFLTNEYTRQFQQEARILAGLRHAGLPHVTDYFLIEGQGQYLVMDFIEGEDLRQRMERSGPIAEKDAILIGISVLDALHHLHSRQPPIIHRDIKPGNIKISPEGQAVLVDFGLAKVLEGNQATITGARAMTPGYSPPEQYGTSRTDERSDIYSLGATLFACLTGTVPEDGLARLSGNVEDEKLRDILPNLNRKLSDVIDKAMRIHPEDRYQTALDFRKELIECGQMTAYFVDPPTLAPPPLELDGSSKPESSPEGGWAKSNPLANRTAARARRQRREALTRFAIGFLAAMTLLTAGFVALFRDGIPSFFLPAANGQVVETSPPSLQTSSQPEVPAEMTSTQDILPLPTEESSGETATVEPTIETVMPPTASPTPTGGSGELAFASARGGSMQIWILNIRTRQLRQVTNIRDGACQPSWAPDGMRLAFTSPCPGKREQYPGANIYMINVDGSEQIPLTQNPEGNYDPAWSPDGRKLAFTSIRNTIPSISVLDFETQVITPLTDHNFPNFQPSWSPVSRQIAYVHKKVYNQIWIMAEDGSNQLQFSVSGEVNNSTPAWAYDSEAIYFSQASTDSGIPNLVGMRYEDRGKSIEFRIPPSPIENNGPIAGAVMSRDGYWFAFEGWPDGSNHDIFIMTANGAIITRLTTDRAFDFGPAWRPIPGL